jgi:6-phosphogluconolactonase
VPTLQRIEGIAGPSAVLVAPDLAGIAAAAAEWIAGWSSEAIAARGSAHVALTGGSSASALAAALREPRRLASIDWAHTHFWWGDERLVPTDHPDSNFGAAFRDLLGPDGVPAPPANIHPFPVETALADGFDADWIAEAYATELVTTLPHREGLPAFDVILLGMGPDGHVLSVFPQSAALAPEAPLVMAVPAPTHVEPHVARVTLSPRLLSVGWHVMLMVGGAAKATMVRQVLTGERDPYRWPAQLALRDNATWLLDAGSAAELDLPRVPA